MLFNNVIYSNDTNWYKRKGRLAIMNQLRTVIVIC